MSASSIRNPSVDSAIQLALEDFQRHLSSDVPKLIVQHAYDWTWGDDYRSHYPTGFPSKIGGVYLRFAADGMLMYVGIATGCFDKRVWCNHEEWNDRWIDIIEFPPHLMFLAASLESFLIKRFNPPMNRIGRTQ